MTSKILFLAIFFSFYFGAVAQNTLKSVTQIEFSDSVNLWKHYDNLRKDKIVSKTESAKRICDSTAQKYNNRADSLTNKFSDYYSGIIDEKKDSINQKRIDSLKSVSTELAGDFHKSKSMFLEKDINSLAGLNKRIVKNNFLCDSCTAKNEYDDVLNEYSEKLDSLYFDFSDQQTQLLDNSFDSLADFYDMARDSVSNFCSTLIWHQQDEIERILDRLDYAAMHCTRFVASGSINTHNSFRGRDNGLILSSIIPEVAFYHQCGLSVSFSGVLINEKGKEVFDSKEADIAYDLFPSKLLSIELAYSHFWFISNSEIAKSIINNNAALDIDFSFNTIDLDIFPNLGWGNKTEITLYTALSFNLDIRNCIGADKLSFVPTINFICGDQYINFIAQSQKEGNSNTTTNVAKSKKIFSALSYEPAFALFYRIGKFVISSKATYINPVNVIDSSTKDSYFNFNLSLNYTIR